MNLLRYICLISTTVLIQFYTLTSLQAKEELTFGVYPVFSPNQIISMFSPITRHISTESGIEINLRSAPDFSQFIERTQKGEYDIIYTAPHMGRLAHLESGYLPIAQTRFRIIVTAVTLKESPIQSLAEMQGKRMAIGSELSMTYQITNRELSRYQLDLNDNVQFIPTANFSNVLTSILRSEADAGATGSLLWDKAPSEQKERLKEIFRSTEHPGLVVMMHPRLGDKKYKEFQQYFASYSVANTAPDLLQKRRTFLEYDSLDFETLKSLDPFTEVLIKQYHSQ